MNLDYESAAKYFFYLYGDMGSCSGSSCSKKVDNATHCV